MHLQLDYYNNNDNKKPTILWKKKNHLSFLKYSPKTIPPPSSNIRNSTPGKLAGPCIPLHPLFVSINHSAAELSKNGQVLGAPTVTLGAPVAATLASFLLLLFVIPLFLRFFPPFLPTSFPSLPRYFFVSRNFLNAFLRSFITILFASLFFFLSSLTKFYPFLVWYNQ